MICPTPCSTHGLLYGWLNTGCATAGAAQLPERPAEAMQQRHTAQLSTCEIAWLARSAHPGRRVCQSLHGTETQS